jgi:hypothetical protein
MNGLLICRKECSNIKILLENDEYMCVDLFTETSNYNFISSKQFNRINSTLYIENCSVTIFFNETSFKCAEKETDIPNHVAANTIWK